MAELTPQAIMKHGEWVGTRLNVIAAGYNTNLIKKADVPKSYEDLLDPRWAGGKMYWHAGTSTGGGLFVSNLRIAWGEDDHVRMTGPTG